MKGLGQRYVQYINRTYRRSGTLWEGRFRSCLMAEEDYVLACYRYIEMNPVRAGMVEHPADYRWSSYRVNAQRERSTLIKPHSLYKALGGRMTRGPLGIVSYFAISLPLEWLIKFVRLLMVTTLWAVPSFQRKWFLH